MRVVRNLDETVYQFENYELDPQQRTLSRSGGIIPLTPKVFDTLLVMVKNGGRVMNKDELMTEVWPDTVVEEVNLAHNISMIRRALNQKAGENRFIVTVPGRGYSFVAKVTEIEPDRLPPDKTAFEYELTRSRLIIEEETAADEASSPLYESELYSPRVRPQLIAREQVPVARPAERKALMTGLGVAGLLCVLAIAGIAYWSHSLDRGRTATESATMTMKRLTTIGTVLVSTLSPDGKLFVYSTRDKDGLETLWLGQVDGGDIVQMHSPTKIIYYELLFSPDARNLYYVASSNDESNHDVFKSPVIGGVAEKVATNIASSISFSPDGKQLAYVRSDRDRNVSVLVVGNADGSGERDLTTSPVTQHFSTALSWSPDGSLIAVSSANDQNGYTYDILAVRVDNGNATPLTSGKWNGISRLLWSSDGTGLVVSGATKESWEFNQLWFVSYPKGEARKITNDLSYYGAAAISSDSRQLLAVQAQSICNVWVGPPADLSKATQITFGSIGRCDGLRGMAWSPDGKIAYISFGDNSQNVWMMDADGKGSKQLSPSGHRDSCVSVTADGRYVVYDSNRTGSPEVWRMAADGGNPKQLTFGGGNYEPDVSPDGGSVVYRSVRDGRSALWRISIDGGEPVRLTDRPALWPSVSPDSKLVACQYNDGISREPRLAIVPIEGGAPTKLFEVPRLANFRYGIHWTPDQKGVCYRDWANGIWMQPLDGGEPNRLKGLPEEKIFSYGWSRDGKQFAFVRGKEIRDVVLISSFK